MRRTGRDIARAAFVIGLLSAWPAAAQQWPQFRGPGASGVAFDDPRLPERGAPPTTWRGSIAIPGRGWSSPVVWGDHVFVVTAVNTRQPSPDAESRAIVSRAIARRADDRRGHHAGDRRISLDPVRRRCPDGPNPLGAGDQGGRARPGRAPEELVRVRDAGHRRRARLRVPRLRRPVRLRHERASRSGRSRWPRQDAHRLGSAGLARRSTTAASTSSTTTKSGSFIAAFDARTGAELWRTERAGEGIELVLAVIWQTGQRTEIVTTGTRKVRSYDTNGALLWEFAGMTSIHAVTPVASHGLLFVSSGYFPDMPRPTYAIRPGARATSRSKPGKTSNAVHRVVEPDPRLCVPLANCRRRSVLHADGSRHRDRNRPVDRPGDLRPPAHRARYGHVFGVAVVVPREDLRHQRGRRDIRDADRPAVQAPGSQPARTR